MDRHPLARAYAALAAVCFFWGTTYLGIRMALESFEPVRLVAFRFVVSGVLMAAFLRWRGLAPPRGRELLWTAVNGLLILGVGNLCLTLSEQRIPSSLAALFVSISPFWFVAIEALVPGGERPSPRALAGMALGFFGAGLLFVPNLLDRGFHGHVWQGFLILQAGGISWSLGSVLQKRYPSRAHPFSGAAAQQLAVGLAYLGPALIHGPRPEEWSARGTGAMIYLIVFGSIVGYSAYIYALEKLPVSLVSVYTYVNPVVAAILGALIYGEPFGWRELCAMAVIFSGVAAVKSATPPSQSPSPPAPHRSLAGR